MLEKIRSHFPSLTPKQCEVCLMMADGLLSKQIADRLGASINTVKTHRTEIFRKTGAASLLDLARRVDLLRDPETPVATPGNTDKPALIARKTAGSPLLVLVVEDHRSLREALVKALHRLGHVASGIANGEELDEALAAGPLDIVLLDIGLGEGREDGFALAARLRRQTRCGIIMTTARGEREARIRGFEEGADAYLVKPVDFDELNAVMHSVMRRLR